MSLGKPTIKLVFMDDDMRDYAINEATKALETSNSEKLVASYMKMSFEKKYKSVWHCIVGRNFGAYVTHEVGRYIYFYIGQKGFLIWSTPS
ncbi:hypothetical protein FGO68_gene10441 [Halteria grandinella]|uniref:Dynein light chain n=1 Tax=Halteria grandinella TaxID=5974 RepID=A0A8J8STZ9_HALGN|nr:hypothetical protein FGO68_gene10441 [Halteria grandinella]